jgi:hypothetical protein
MPFGEQQVYWYRNMLHYAQKHLSRGQVPLLRIAIIVGMGLRSVAALFGIRRAPLRESLAGYWAVIRGAV